MERDGMYWMGPAMLKCLEGWTTLFVQSDDGADNGAQAG